MGEQGLHVLGMVQPAPNAAAVGRPDDHRNADGAVGAVSGPRRLTDDLADAGPDEVGELYLRDGPHALHCRPQGDAGDGRLGQRGVDDPLFAEGVEEAVCREEDAAPGRDVLAHDEDRGVAGHLLPHGLAHGLEDRHDRDGAPPDAYTSL